MAELNLGEGFLDMFGISQLGNIGSVVMLVFFILIFGALLGAIIYWYFRKRVFKCYK